MKDPIKTSEKELNDEEIENLSDAEFRILVIRVLTELIEPSQNEEVKAIQSEIKENVQGTKSEG